MKEWPADILELVSAVAQARREARDSGPRNSNDDLEAAIYVASAFAMQRIFDEREARPTEEEVSEVIGPEETAATEPVTMTEPSEEEHEEETHNLTHEDEDNESHSHRKRRKKTADD